MARETTGGSNLTGLTPEQIKKMTEQESNLAAMQAQANRTKGFSEKENRKGVQYENNARAAANLERIAAASAQVGDVNPTELDKITAENEAAIAEADLATKEAEELNASIVPPDTKKLDAYQRLYDEFNKIGLGALVESGKDLLMTATDIRMMPDMLKESDAYIERFSANKARIAKGLRALTPAEYLSKEDAYQDIMRRYGLPQSYYEKGLYGKQAGFDKLIENDVDDAELTDRISTAQKRVLNTNPEVLKALKQFYPDINTADILAYTLDPKNAIEDINRKVTAAEIGGAALQQGLEALGGTAESLAGQGITKAEAQRGYANVAEMTPRGSQLASIYGEEPYTQQTAEAEEFNTTGAADAVRKRKKLKALEEASFSGSSGVGALGRDRAANYGTTQSGFGSY
jgi:hypothetical protein